MKKIEFETSKGSWLVLDSKDAPSSFNRYLRDIEKELRVRLAEGYKLSEITEEQASEVVESEYVDFIDKYIYRDYMSNNAKKVFCDKLSSIESLHSLLKSKGIHLFKNPAPLLHHTRIEAEQKTFYNPYIFKL